MIRTFGNITLICGDMREVLPGLTERADLLLSDPPYRLTSGGKNTGELGGKLANAVYDNSGELFPIVEWQEMAPLMFAACAPDADAIVMTNDRNEAQARIALEATGFGFHRLLVWKKGTVTPNRWFMQELEFGLYMWKGRARPLNDKSAKPLTRIPVAAETLHPTEKPVRLMLKWIELTTDPGELVLDPFMGSGAAMVAAAVSGRRAIGIELSPQWFSVACQRVERAVAGLPPKRITA